MKYTFRGVKMNLWFLQLFPPLHGTLSVVYFARDKCRYAVCDALTGNVSDQVCEAEKDEDGHALNLKGENYTTHTGPLPPLLYEPDYLARVIKIYICTLCY